MNGRAPARRSDNQTNPVIIFLDFDGVLHPEPCMDEALLFENAPRLADALAPYLRVFLVLSTAWRHASNYEQLLAPLPPLLARRVIGVTPNFSDFLPDPTLIPYRRQAECMRWMLQNRLQGQAWLALDDRPSEFVPYCENLIACHPQTGFDESASARLSSALARHFDRHGHNVDLLID